jgi:thiol-disulfide isomerase/thioredoxin
MTRLLTALIALGASVSSVFSQTTAMNFNRPDCNGTMRNLYSDLDAGNVVIIEFFMLSCGSCITAGSKLEQMKTKLNTEFPGKIKSYAIGYSNSYSCINIKNWVNNNGFTSIPMDSGAAQVAYYGGMGMPTVVVIGGTDHKVLGAPYIGFSTSDTTTAAGDIRNFFATTGISEKNGVEGKLEFFPNPASTELNINLILNKPSEVRMDITDLAGRIVKPVENRFLTSVETKVDISGLPAGVYFLRINSNGNSTTRKINIVR